jgi:hypothetical protein
MQVLSEDCSVANREKHPLRRQHPPTIEAVVAVIEQLITGQLSRDAVASWAEYWYTNDDIRLDTNIRTALYHLTGADAITVDRPYLYMETDFADWLNEARSLLGETETATRIRAE